MVRGRRYYECYGCLLTIVSITDDCEAILVKRYLALKDQHISLCPIHSAYSVIRMVEIVDKWAEYHAIFSG